MKKKNQDFIKLNKNLIIGALAGIGIAAIIAKLFDNQPDYLLTTFTVVAEYAAFFSVLFGLFFYDNWKKYKSEKNNFKKDLVKLGSSVGFGEIIYIIVRWFLGYYLLTIEYDPNLATIISQLVGWAIFMLAVNYFAKIFKLHKT